jgi:DNA-binding transcriptional MerR regulator
MTTSYTIQQAAEIAGLSVHTLRYYERIGLIDPIVRQANSHRLYRQEDMEWIRFLLKLRSTGLPIRSMLRYAELRRLGNSSASVSERKAMIEQHAASLEIALMELQSNLAVMHKKVALYAEMERNMLPVISHDKVGQNEHN